MEITYSLDGDELDHQTLNEILHLAKHGQGREVYRGAKLGWVLYAVATTMPEGLNATGRGGDIGIIHATLEDIQYSPFNDHMSEDERDELEKVLNELEKTGVVNQNGDVWELADITK